MRLLFDTSIALWSRQIVRGCPGAARREIESAEAVFVSSMLLWEMVIKAGLGKLKVDFDRLPTRMGAAGFAIWR